ncbi:MAG: ABC transporter ATP-binding protein [Chloroflexi bacterium]|nr:MAG: ABC transporter ATP-binding protein [Chloroflexota bacterium]
MGIVYNISQVTKIYRGSAKKANDCLTLTIREGEIFGLLGPNGAGKSTLINQIAGITRPTSGNIHLFGIDVARNPEVIPEYVALQPQRMSALVDLYPREALLYTAQLRHVSKTVARQQMEHLIEELELEALCKKLIRHLSGGQQKLVSLALAFIGDRPVQIFDEPTNELDPVVRRRIWEKLLCLHRQGKTIIIVTHNVLEAEQVIEHVGIINHGQLLALGSVGGLKMQVDQRIRLELLLKAQPLGLTQRKIDPNILKSLGETRALTEQHWVILCSRAKTQSTINQIFEHIGMENLDDFRIVTPSLEDVYLQLGGDIKLG